MIRNLFGGSKCRTIDVCDIFGDNSGKALYRLDGNANDESGNYHGTETAITYGGGAYERGAVFNGSTSVIANTSLPSMGTSNAISFYINTATTANQGFIEYSNGTNLIAIYHTSTTLAVRVNALLYTITTTLPKSAFNHLVVSFSTDIPTMYLNGGAVTLGSVGATAIAGTTGLRIGVANVATVQTYTNGSIDQVRIFNRAITATEVATLYTECAPTSTVDNINPFEDGSLKALYQFNGDATDKTGVYNGAVAGTVTYVAGKFGNALNCVPNQSSSYVSITNPSIVATSCWVKFNSLPDSATFKAIYGGTGTNNILIVRYVSAGVYNISTYLQTGGKYYTVTSGNVSLSTGVWTHFYTHIRSDGALSLYINGNPVFTNTTSTGTSVAYNGSIVFGQYDQNGSYTAYAGDLSIDQVRIFNKALTPMEVASLYNETTPLEEPMHSLVDPFKDNSGKALYRLDGNALDESGNYNGTATSVTYGAGRFGRCKICTKSVLSYISASSLVLGATSSISFWVMRTTADADQIIFAHNTDALIAGNYSNYWMKDGVDSFNFEPLTAQVMLTLPDVWYHIVFTDNGSAIKAYRDSVEVVNKTAYNSMVGWTFNYIGSYNSSTPSLAGMLDQVRIFNRALTAGEVQTLYTEI